MCRYNVCMSGTAQQPALRRARGFLRRVLALGATAAVLMGTMLTASPALAYSTTAFNPGNIIDDALFYKGDAMSASEVQTKLNQLLPSCLLGTPGYTPGQPAPSGSGNILASNCLRDFRMNTMSRAADQYCKGYAGVSGETAAQMIAKVGASCGISQKVLLVMLEKEQGLVTDSWPVTRQYNYALGMNCPDSGPGGSANCNSDSAGFFLQLYLGARQLKVYQADPGSFRYRANQWNSIQWHTNAACGASQVFIENAATAGLYTYTPYRPNQAAIDAGGGTGDACSTYGNRNFNRFYTNWFGPTHASPPGGDLHTGEVVPTPTGVWVRGWAGDAGGATRKVQLYLGNSGWMLDANTARTDGKAGFQGTLAGSFSGTQRLCAYSNVELGCKTVNFGVNAPVGDLNAASVSDGKIKVRGWGVDADRLGSSLEVHVYVGNQSYATTASTLRADVAAVYPSYGQNRGFEWEMDAERWAGTTQTVCAYGINVTPEGYRHGANPQFGQCKTVKFPESTNKPPQGSIDQISVTNGTLSVTGWSFDPNFTGSNDVKITLGSNSWTVKANVARPDVQRAFGLANDKHGYSWSMPVASSWPNPGSVCVAAVNVNSSGAVEGAATNLGCRTVAWIQDAAKSY